MRRLSDLEEAVHLQPQSTIVRTDHYPPPRVDRMGAIWRSKLWILIGAIAVAAATYGVCRAVPKIFQASATVRVSLPPQSPSAISSQSVTASSDLAGQYAQLAKLAPVLDTASRHLGMSESALASVVSAGTVSGQNLISVQAQAHNAAAAGARANAVAAALADTITRGNRVQATTYSRAVARQLAPVNSEIRRARTAMVQDARSPVALASDETLLSNLLIQRSQVLSSVAEAAATQPSADVFAPAGAGSQVQPRPTLYTVVAFLVALVVLAQVAVAVRSHRAAGPA